MSVHSRSTNNKEEKKETKKAVAKLFALYGNTKITTRRLFAVHVNVKKDANSSKISSRPVSTQLTSTCSKSTMETLEKGVEYA